MMLHTVQFRQSRTAPDGELLPEWFVAVSNDLEVIVGGDDSGPTPAAITCAQKVLDNQAHLTSLALALLKSFMKDQGTWHLHTIDCSLQARELHCDFLLGFSFESGSDRWEYTYTDFKVGFLLPADAAQPGRPVKFLVGFH